MKKFFKTAVAVAVAAAVMSTVAFAADNVIYKRDFSDGVKEDGFQGGSAKTEIKDGVLHFTTGKAWESPYWELGPTIKEVMEKNNLTEATVTISFEIASEDAESVGVLIRGVDNRVTEDLQVGSGNYFIRFAGINDLSDMTEYEYSFEMTADDLATIGIEGGDTYRFMFDNIKTIPTDGSVEFTFDNLVVSIDELGGGGTTDGNTNGGTANKPSNTGDMLPVAMIIAVVGAGATLCVVSKKRRTN